MDNVIKYFLIGYNIKGVEMGLYLSFNNNLNILNIYIGFKI